MRPADRASRGRGGDAPTPLDGVDAVLADLDGVVYRGGDAIPYAADALTRAAGSVRVGYITNNASRRPDAVAVQLAGFGLAVTADDVVTSPQAAVRLLAERIPPGSAVLVVGGVGLTSVLEENGYRVVRSADDAPAAVVQGFAPEVGWTQLAEAAYALQGDGATIPWIATNTDWTIPQERGTAPGNGTLVSAVHTAVGRLPEVAGKPEPEIFRTAATRFGSRSALVIGDRLDTDILGARRAGMRSALVLTGIDGPKQVLAAEESSRPDFLLDDLRQLFEPYQAPIATERRGGAVDTRVGSAVVRRDGSALTVLDEGARRIDLLRAGSAAIWSSGLKIYGLRVPPELYS